MSFKEFSLLSREEEEEKLKKLLGDGKESLWTRELPIRKEDNEAIIYFEDEYRERVIVQLKVPFKGEKELNRIGAVSDFIEALPGDIKTDVFSLTVKTNEGNFDGTIEYDGAGYHYIIDVRLPQNFGEKAETPKTKEIKKTPSPGVMPDGEESFWTHKWKVDIHGKERLFIWQVNGKENYYDTDKSFAYIRKQVLKQAKLSEKDQDPRWKPFLDIKDVTDSGPKPNFWFKRNLGWDQKGFKETRNNADFTDLAEYDGPSPYNRRGTGFRYIEYANDPEIYENIARIKEEKARKEREKRERELQQSFIGENTYETMEIKSSRGYFRHKTPSPSDEFYLRNHVVDVYNPHYLEQGTKVVVIARGNEDNDGWALISFPDGTTGWINEQAGLSKPKKQPLPGFREYTTKSGDKLENILKEKYPDFKERTGFDWRTIGEAVVALNPDAFIERDKKNDGILDFLDEVVEGYKDVADPDFKKTRDTYQGLVLKSDADLLLPDITLIEQM